MPFSPLCTPIVDKLLAAKPNINAANNAGETALHPAVRSQKLYRSDISLLILGSTIIDKLLVAQADVNAVNKNGDTPLHIASRDGNFPLILSLIKQSPDLTLKDRTGKTAWDLVQETQETNDFSILYPLAGTLTQQGITLARSAYGKIAIMCLIGSTFIIAKRHANSKTTKAMKSIEEKLTTLSDKKATILGDLHALQRRLIRRVTQMSAGNEVHDLKKLFETSSIQTIVEEINTLCWYHRLWGNQFTQQWKDLYSAHKDFFDGWREIHKILTLPPKPQPKSQKKNTLQGTLHQLLGSDAPAKDQNLEDMRTILGRLNNSIKFLNQAYMSSSEIAENTQSGANETI